MFVNNNLIVCFLKLFSSKMIVLILGLSVFQFPNIIFSEMTERYVIGYVVLTT